MCSLLSYQSLTDGGIVRFSKVRVIVERYEGSQPLLSPPSTMPLATIKNSTLCFSYEDSGPLSGLYTMLIMVHEIGFHSGGHGSVIRLTCLILTHTPVGIFSPMVPFAVANCIRLILINHWDYPGSKPLSDAELAKLGSSCLQMHAKALTQQETNISLFLAWLVHKEKIPAMSVDWRGKGQGGIVLVAWSFARTITSRLPCICGHTPGRHTPNT